MGSYYICTDPLQWPVNCHFAVYCSGILLFTMTWLKDLYFSVTWAITHNNNYSVWLPCSEVNGGLPLQWLWLISRMSAVTCKQWQIPPSYGGQFTIRLTLYNGGNVPPALIALTLVDLSSSATKTVRDWVAFFCMCMCSVLLYTDRHYMW